MPFYTKHYIIEEGLLKLLHHLHVRRKPIHALPLRPLQPSCRPMLLQFHFSLRHAAPETMHHEMEFRVIILHGAYFPFHANPHIQLLAYFADNGPFLRLSRLHLSSGEFPLALILAISPLGGEDSSPLVNDGSHHFYCFHFCSFLLCSTSAIVRSTTSCS